MTLHESAPYRNLVLTGPMGVGKTTLGRAVARRLGAEFYDLENEILTREGQSAAAIRELFGEARLKVLETDAIHDLSLHRHAVLVINGTAMLDETNRTRLSEVGSVLCLVCPLNEVLRRQYMARGAWFHNPSNRGVLLSQLKRELRVVALDLPHLDTSRLGVEEATSAIMEFWFSHA